MEFLNILISILGLYVGLVFMMIAYYLRDKFDEYQMSKKSKRKASKLPNKKVEKLTREE